MIENMHSIYYDWLFVCTVIDCLVEKVGTIGFSSSRLRCQEFS